MTALLVKPQDQLLRNESMELDFVERHLMVRSGLKKQHVPQTMEKLSQHQSQAYKPKLLSSSLAALNKAAHNTLAQ